MSGALLLEAAAIYAVVTALTFSGFRFFPQSIDVEFLETRPPAPRPVVLPQLRLVEPPPVTIYAPEIQIQTPRPAPRIKVARMRAHLWVMPPPVQVVVRVVPPAPPKVPGITAPVSIGASHSCERQYPPLAVRLSQQGTTIIEFMVNTDGSVSDVRIAKSSGHETLDDAAIRCASSWRYRPALENGRPVAAPWSTNVQWKLENAYTSMRS